ncbi:MAG: 16S rRNA (adenine(1518)-N(6)/adenine(1519)-N(6))-dimethyltransferase RsmA [Oscillospiraceae bacterium]|nr:16S rRNA (adenine(1518)-N(6)/adenine(1519)-N(6))-dimethyltransferase RsmA [Oscillospiraceae bacterium]
MENLTNPSVIKPIMQKHGFDFSKKLGQNFIINSGICPKMAQMADIDGKGVIEIGPGVGVLTNELSKRAKKVVAFEIDTRLIPVLTETLSDCDNVKIISGDVMKQDLKTIIAQEFGDMPVSVCANLPYYITSPIIMMLLENNLPIDSITVMVQKEAAQRLCAPLPSRQAGAITAAVNYYGTPRLLFNVSRGSFLPAPNVDSAVIRIDIEKRFGLEGPLEKAFFRFIKAAFAQRRKTLPNTLSSQLPISSAEIAEILQGLNIKPTARAEELCLEEMILLSNALYNRL